MGGEELPGRMLFRKRVDLKKREDKSGTDKRAKEREKVGRKNNQGPQRSSFMGDEFDWRY